MTQLRSNSFCLKRSDIDPVEALENQNVGAWGGCRKSIDCGAAMTDEMGRRELRVSQGRDIHL